VFCTQCGSTTSLQDSFCRTCGNAQEPPRPGTAIASGVAASPPLSTAAVKTNADFIAPLTIIGFLVGGFIGFVFRPSVFLIGQLPFAVVITRGAYLTGLEQLLRPTAETSFNQTMAAAVFGAVAGLMGGLLIKSVSSRRA